MEFTVEFKTPGGEKIARKFDADSHWGAAQEASFEPDILELLVATGKTKFGARVVRASDNVTRSVLVEIAGDGPLSVPAGQVNDGPQEALSVCLACGRDKVPDGYEFDVPDGAQCCGDCGIPFEDVAQDLEGFEEVTPEYSGDEGIKEEPGPVKCDRCDDDATDHDDYGAPICEGCFLELIDEPDPEPEPEGTDPEKRHYLVIYGDHLEPGHEDRVALRVKSPNPRAALTAAEYAVTEKKGPEWIEAFYQVGLTPTISACEPPEVDKAKKFVQAEAPAIEEEAEEETLYKVNFFTGSQAISTEVFAENAEDACVIAAIEHVDILAPHVGDKGVIAASAANMADSEDTWGPGVVPVPVEMVVGFSEMTREQRRTARDKLGIVRMEVGPAYGMDM